MAAFSVVYDGQHGKTVHSDNPKLDAYKYTALAIRDGRGYQLIFNADGSVTAAVDRLTAITYERGN